MVITQSTLAAELLQLGEVVAIPTETVYGLAANAYNEQAVEKIFALKNRPHYNPLIVHLSSFLKIHEVAEDIPQSAMALAEAFLPGPLTLILKKKSHIPDLVTAGKATVAVRVPNHPLCLDLLQSLDFPLAAPSANPFGSISSTTAEHVDSYFGKQLKLILDGGPCLQGVESTIIGFQNEEVIVYRHGSIPIEKIISVVGKVSVASSNNHSPDAPGMLSKHYAPKTNIRVFHNILDALTQSGYDKKRIGLLLFQQAIPETKAEVQEILSSEGSLEEAAKELYAALHRLDQQGLDLILAERFPDHGLGKTLNDRLQRASS